MNRQGFTSIEAIIGASFLIAVVAGVLLILYFSFTRVWVENSIYDGLTCQIESGKDCISNAKKKINSVVPFGEIKNLWLGTKGQGHLDYTVIHGYSISIQQNLPQELIQ